MYTVTNGGYRGTYTEADIDRMVEQGMFSSNVDFRIIGQGLGYGVALCRGLNNRLLLNISLDTSTCNSMGVISKVLKWYKEISHKGFRISSYDYIRVYLFNGDLTLYEKGNTLKELYEQLADGSDGIYTVVGKCKSFLGTPEYPALAVLQVAEGKIDLSSNSELAISNDTVDIVERMVENYIKSR